MAHVEGFIATTENQSCVEISLKFQRDAPCTPSISDQMTTRIPLNKSNLSEMVRSLYLDNCVKELLLQVAEKTVSVKILKNYLFF